MIIFAILAWQHFILIEPSQVFRARATQPYDMQKYHNLYSPIRSIIPADHKRPPPNDPVQFPLVETATTNHLKEEKGPETGRLRDTTSLSLSSLSNENEATLATTTDNKYDGEENRVQIQGAYEPKLISLNKPVMADVRGNLGPPGVVTQPGISDWLKDRWQCECNVPGLGDVRRI